MAKPDDGYVLIYRRLLDHPVFRSPAEALAFSFLVAKAAWRPTRVQYKGWEAVLERGQGVVSERDLAKAMERSPSWAHRFLVRLEKAGMISRKAIKAKHPRSTPEARREAPPNVVTVCNYDKYQVSLGSIEAPIEAGGGTGGGTILKNERKEVIKGKSMSLPLEDTGKEKEKEVLVFPDWLPAEPWADFLAMRKAIKKPATLFAQRKLITKLERFHKRGFDPVKILDRSIINSWQDVYEPREGEASDYRLPAPKPHILWADNMRDKQRG